MLMLHMLSCFSSQFSIGANYFDELLCVFSKERIFFFKHQMLCAGALCPVRTVSLKVISLVA